MYHRHLQPLIRAMLREFRIVYLSGPRQAGKTTLARLLARDGGMEYLTLDDQATLAAAQSDPHGFIRSLGARRAVLDEVQYAPALVPAIKEASDRLEPQEKGKFLLTGSADIFRSARTQESLPGHMARLELMPLSITELHGQSLNIIDCLAAGDFAQAPATAALRESLANLVLRGGYPEVQSKSRRGRLESNPRNCMGETSRLPCVRVKELDAWEALGRISQSWQPRAQTGASGCRAPPSAS